jgi:hypothetical protein
VPRELRFAVPERMTAKGRVDTPLKEEQVLDIAKILKARNIQAVAIGFLHSYANDAHEKRAAALLAKALPDVSITLSSAVCPEIREYERFSTACANAYVQPLMASYLERLAAELKRRGFTCPLYLMTSGGGLTTLQTARLFPVRLVESGPAGDPVGRPRARGGLKEVLFDRRHHRQDLLHRRRPPRECASSKWRASGATSGQRPAGAYPRDRDGRDRRRRRLDRAPGRDKAHPGGSGQRGRRARPRLLWTRRR